MTSSPARFVYVRDCRCLGEPDVQSGGRERPTLGQEVPLLGRGPADSVPPFAAGNPLSSKRAMSRLLPKPAFPIIALPDRGEAGSL